MNAQSDKAERSRTEQPPLAAWALFALLFAALMGAGAALSLNPARDHGRADQFDAQGARARLERILEDQAPHPIDTAAQDAVRERLLQEIRALGFTPELHEGFACRPQPRGPLIDCGYVRNIVFEVGPANAPAVLAVSHYDSVPAGPGASDDGLGVSVWLEVARVLAAEPLQKRVIVLISDGEEQALLGAYAFARDDALMEGVVSLVNLEARGSRGPAVFFESNQPNGRAVAAYGAVGRPVANSVMADVYRLLPNSTDVTALTRPGLDVINIAVLDGLEDYHTPNDTIASQDLRSVQHMGDSALAVMRRVAGASTPSAPGEMAYTDIASRLFVYAPTLAVLAVLGLSGLVCFIAFWRAEGGSRWRAFAAPPIVLLLATGFAYAADAVLRQVRPGEDYAFAHPEPARAFCILFAVLAVVLALMVVRPARSPQQLSASALFWFALAGGIASSVASGISILFASPALAYSLGWLLSLAWKPAEAIGRWCAALLVLIVWGPTLFLVELALGFSMPLVFALLVALLLLPWLGIAAQMQGRAAWRGLAGAAGLGAVIAVAAAALAPSRSEARPQPVNLSYFVDVAQGTARVLGGPATRALPPELRDAFSAQLVLPGDRAQTWAAPADLESIPTPSLEDVTISESGPERGMRARLDMNGAYRATIRIPVAVQPLRVRLNGVEASFADAGGERGEFVNLACQGRMCDGAEIEIVLAAAPSDSDWYIVGQTPGLAVGAADAIRQRRPATTTPIQFGDAAIALTRFRPGG